jgi:hypothetical protein
VVAFDELPELSNYPEGRHYRFENVQIDEYEGDLQLILDPDITDWTEIQVGVGKLRSRQRRIESGFTICD